MLPRNSHFRAYLALAAVCFFWGTTYLGIRMALESFSPFALVCIRYIISGSILLAAAFFRKAHVPWGRELFFTALFGVLILGIGNGCLAFAELLIPSGLAAMFITTSPFWMVGIEALLPGGEKLHLPTVLGMLVGFAGTLLLVTPGVLAHGIRGPVLQAFLMLQVGCCAWSFGSISQRRYPTRAHPVVSGAVQQLATGLVYVVPALLVKSEPVRWNTRGISALVYLIIFGSLVGYSAYVYALDRLPVSVVSLYNYINPVVAVFLGWLIYREPVGWREIAAMVIIFAGVAIVKRVGKRYGHRLNAGSRIPTAPQPASLDVEPRHTTV
jgi:drug/metabolite transporter (DMT)-like permease